jgi:hypothetical protein
MEVEELACMHICTVVLYVDEKKNRKFWIHPLLSNRSNKGLFILFYNDLRKNKDIFFNYVKMSVNLFNELMEQLRKDFMGQQTNMSECISPVEKLVVILK